MKRSISLLIALCFAISSFAQAGKFEVGAMGAPGIIFLYGNQFVNHNNRAGFSYATGVSFQYNFTKIFSLHTDLLYEQKGTISQITYVNSDGVKLIPKGTRYGLNYVNMPILARATIGKKVKFFANAGPYIGVLVHQTAELKDVYNNHNNMTRPVDIGLSMGVGVSVPIDDRFYMSMEARNNTGLMNVSKGVSDNGITQVMNSGNVKTNSTNFFVSFVYKINAKPKKVSKS